MNESIPTILDAYDRGNVTVMGVLNELDKIEKVKIPTRTLEDAVKLALEYWEATQPANHIRDIIRRYENFDISAGNPEMRSQSTHEGMRTIFGRRLPSEKGYIDFPFFVMIRGNHEPLNESSLKWLIEQKYITATEIPNERP